MKRRRKLPARFSLAGLQLNDKRLKDILPQPAPPLPPSSVGTQASGSASPPQIDERSTSGVRARLRQVLTTTRNSFGLFRRYFAETYPSHDPESELNISALSNIVDTGSRTASSSVGDVPLFGPYPNKTSFQLGDWYWNHGVQKSQENFKELLNIVGDDGFRPADVRAANWGKINHQLALNEWDEEEWVEEDAGWKTSPVTISVPFHRLADNPGARDYGVPNFHYRSLISVIRDRIKDESNHPHFHYEPYELLWQSSDEDEEYRVYGEMYTSPAFIDAHNDLQNSPGEPNCDLPRVVVALMFWSDATHLASFGNAKLWPLYMFFGNESKYRRRTTSHNLCEHVAYFECVCIAFVSLSFSYFLMTCNLAPRLVQRLCKQVYRHNEAEKGVHDSLSP